MTDLWLVDAFTDRPFSGNPAGVVRRPAGPVDAEHAQRVAAELGYSETAVVHPEEDGWRLRWWTPSTEVDLCGHATLATAEVLYLTEAVPLDQPIRFLTRSGVLSASRDGQDRVWLDLPAWPVAPHPSSLPSPLPAPGGVPALLGGVAGEYLGRTRVTQANDVVEVADVTALDAIHPDVEAIAALGSGGLIVLSPGEDTDVAMRYFAPALGVAEDPVTGSAACTIAPLWSDRVGRSELTIEQRSARGGRLWTRIVGDRVHVAGHAVITVAGELRI